MTGYIQVKPTRMGWATGLFMLFCALFSAQAQAELSFDEFYQKHGAVILLILPKSGSIVGANEAASQFYGYSRDELLKMGIQDINALTAEEVAAERARAKEENRNFFIFRHRLKNGDIKTVEVHSSPYQYFGQTVLISVIHDISRQREIQDDLWHYQSQLEQMVDRQTAKLEKSHKNQVMFLVAALLILFLMLLTLIYAFKKQKEAKRSVEFERKRLDEIIWGTRAATWEWNVQSGETDFNQRWVDIVGYTLDELKPFTIDTWINLAHPEDLEHSNELLQKNFRKELDYYECECRMKHKDGHWVWVLDRGKVVEWDKEGKPLRMSGTHVDITRRKTMEEELKRTTRIAEDANKAKSEFLATMSHELRTPMMGIRGVHELLRENEVVRAQEESLLDDLDLSSRTLMSLLDDILDLSKIEAGQLHLEVDAWEPAKIVENIVSLYRPSALKKDIELSCNAPDCFGMWCETDDIRLRQIISNLVSNAVKFTQEGSVRVEMNVLTGSGKERLEINVIDSGIGIAKENQQTIFHRFMQGDQSTTKKFGGTGLGLAICHELTEMMRGDLTVESQPGKGSTFKVSLPVKWMDKRPSEGQAEDHPAEALEALNVLLAEDNLVNQKVVSSMLERHGHSVTVAQNGLEAVEQASQQAFDVILMDILMPEMDGMEASKEIRASGGPNANAPIIAFTADAVKEHQEQFKEAGINSVVVKPVKFDRLMEQIAEALWSVAL